MRSFVRTAEGDELTAPTRIVCLPGAYDSAEQFLHYGFDAAVRERGLAIDMVFVDPQLRDLTDRSPAQRLKRDIVEPARLAGCSVWLAGISLGGFMALDYAACNPGQLHGVCLLAPYLGNRMVTAEIARAPGLSAWDPGALAQSDDERRIWRFIQTCRDVPSLYLGYGREDRFADSHALMAEALPPDAVDIVPGGHDWVTWKTLWEHFLDSRFK